MSAHTTIIRYDGGVEIKIQKVQKSAQLPQYQTEGAAAVDLHACIDEPITIPPTKTAIVPTGVAIQLPDGYEAQVRARSGLAAKHAIGLANGIGTIDSDYRGEICAIRINWGDQDFVVESGMRIAQMVIAKYEHVIWREVDSVEGTSRRDKDKFGSTGV
ncbi:dUTP diphosphatase [Candidatus Saccharibacteria bacterium]|nr:dUTP diphosphatase [Candidatus Saccharibacteria bacterium]